MAVAGIAVALAHDDQQAVLVGPAQLGAEKPDARLGPSAQLRDSTEVSLGLDAVAAHGTVRTLAGRSRRRLGGGRRRGIAGLGSNPVRTRFTMSFVVRRRARWLREGSSGERSADVA